MWPIYLSLKDFFIAVFVYHRDIKEVCILLRYKRLSKTKIGENLISGKLNPARNKQTNEQNKQKAAKAFGLIITLQKLFQKARGCPINKSQGVV